MILADISEYFENYAVSHKQLLHNTADPSKATYFCMNTDKNTDEFIRDNAMDTILILLVPDKELNKSHDNYTWFRNLAFLVLQRVPDVTNDNITAAQNTCESIANDFMTRIIADRAILLDSVNDTGVSMQPAGPLGEFHYGYMTMFTQVDEFAYEVDPSKWND